MLPGQRLPHNLRIVSAPHQTIAVLLQVLKRPDRLPEFGFRKAPSLLAVADVLQDTVALNEKQVLVPQFEVEPVPVQIVYSASRLMSNRVRAFVDYCASELRRAPFD